MTEPASRLMWDRLLRDIKANEKKERSSHTRLSATYPDVLNEQFSTRDAPYVYRADKDDPAVTTKEPAFHAYESWGDVIPFASNSAMGFPVTKDRARASGRLEDPEMQRYVERTTFDADPMAVTMSTFNDDLLHAPNYEQVETPHSTYIDFGEGAEWPEFAPPTPFRRRGGTEPDLPEELGYNYKDTLPYPTPPGGFNGLPMPFPPAEEPMELNSQEFADHIDRMRRLQGMSE